MNVTPETVFKEGGRAQGGADGRGLLRLVPRQSVPFGTVAGTV